MHKYSRNNARSRTNGINTFYITILCRIWILQGTVQVSIASTMVMYLRKKECNSKAVDVSAGKLNLIRFWNEKMKHLWLTLHIHPVCMFIAITWHHVIWSIAHFNSTGKPQTILSEALLWPHVKHSCGVNMPSLSLLLSFGDYLLLGPRWC